MEVTFISAFLLVAALCASCRRRRKFALAELGVQEGASEAEIRAAYWAMIAQHRPDRGGSHAKAARTIRRRRRWRGS